MKHIEYKGELAKPSKVGLENKDALLARQLRGLGLLCDHYEIEEADPVVRYTLLSIFLAQDWVPYFRLAAASSKRGPKPDMMRPLLLEIDVAIQRANGVCSDAKALRVLCEKVSPWKGKNADGPTLARRRREHRDDPMVKVVRAAVKTLNAKALGNVRRSLTKK
jgi:hypothetical protein